MAEFTTFNARPSVAVESGGRRATGADFGGGEGLIKAGKALTDFADAQLAASARVAKRNDIIEDARLSSDRSEFELENGAAFLNSDLTIPENMTKAINASSAANNDFLSTFKGTPSGRTDAAINLQKNHDAFVERLAVGANEQKNTMLQTQMVKGTNSFAAQAAETPHLFRDILAEGDKDLNRYKGATSHSNIGTAATARAQGIMQAALGSSIDQGNLVGAFTIANSKEFRELMTPDMQRAARVKINTNRNKDVANMTAAERLIHDYALVHAEGVDPRITAAWTATNLKGANTPASQLAALRKAVPDMSDEEAARILVSLMTSGKINDFGRADTSAGAETGYGNWLRGNSVKDTPENRALFDALPEAEKLALIGKAMPKQDKPPETGYGNWLRGTGEKDTPENKARFNKLPDHVKLALIGKDVSQKVIPPTQQDLAFGRAASFMGQKELTPEQQDRARQLGHTIDFNGMTLQQAGNAFRVINDGEEPSDEWLARARLLYPVAEKVTFAGKGDLASSLNIILTSMNDYRQGGSVMTPRDREANEAAFRVIAVGARDSDTGRMIEGTGITQAMRDFADRFNIAVPLTSSAVAGAPSAEALKQGPSARTKIGQDMGLWANIHLFKGVGQGLAAAASSFPFRGALSDNEIRVRDMRQKAKNLSESLITSLRSSGGRLLSAEREALVEKIGSVVAPDFITNPEAARVDMEALAESLEVAMDSALTNANNTTGTTRQERADELRLANDINEMLARLGVPPLMTNADIDELKTFPPGTRYFIRDADGNKRMFEKN